MLNIYNCVNKLLIIWKKIIKVCLENLLIFDNKNNHIVQNKIKFSLQKFRIF